MQWSLVSAALVLFAATLARGYTVSVGPHNTQCFYQDATQPNSRILFEFAVVTGGNFDIDFTVKDPKGTVVHSGEAEKEGDFTFVAEPQGEYSFCFSNGMSTVSSKVIEFGVEVAGSGVYGARGVRKNPDAANTKQGADTTAIEQSIETLRNSLSSIQHHVNSYKHRERVCYFISLFALNERTNEKIIKKIVFSAQPRHCREHKQPCLLEHDRRSCACRRRCSCPSFPPALLL